MGARHLLLRRSASGEVNGVLFPVGAGHYVQGVEVQLSQPDGSVRRAFCAPQCPAPTIRFEVGMKMGYIAVEFPATSATSFGAGVVVTALGVLLGVPALPMLALGIGSVLLGTESQRRPAPARRPPTRRLMPPHTRRPSAPRALPPRG